MRHGGWWPDFVPRLFKRNDLISWNGTIHESPQIQGKVGYFQNPIEHFTARSISSMLLKTTKWAKAEAGLFYEADSSRVTVFKIIKGLLAEFSNRYVVKAGFLDGVRGLIQSIFQALHKSIILVYLWEMQNKPRLDFKS